MQEDAATWHHWADNQKLLGAQTVGHNGAQMRAVHGWFQGRGWQHCRQAFALTPCVGFRTAPGSMLRHLTARGLTDIEKVAARLVELSDQYKFDEDSIVQVPTGCARFSIGLLPLKGHRPHRTCSENGSATLHVWLANTFPFEAGRRPALR